MEYVQFKLRIPADLKGGLDRAAEESGLSVTAEIIRRLEASFVVTSVAQTLLRRRQEDLTMVENQMKQDYWLQEQMRSIEDSEKVKALSKKTHYLQVEAEKLRADINKLIRTISQQSKRV